MPPSTVHQYQLDNGLKIVVKVDRRAPVVVSQIWYKIGSSYEPSGATGISHVLEHMMFQGTDKVPGSEFSRIIADNGGKENAFTGRDYTSYFQQLERSRLEIAFELEADRMRNLRLQADDFKREREVVIEERRLRTDDKPTALTYEQFMATAFNNNPYGQPIIGWMSDLEQLTLDDLQQWYQRWYAPNNATLVVAGDVEPEAVFALAKRHFGNLPPSQLTAVKQRQEPPQYGERRLTVRAAAKVPLVLMGYQVPVLRTSDAPWKSYALELLAYVLDGGDSARLSRDLVRGEALAASAGAGYDLYARHDSLFLLEGVPVDGVTPAKIEQALKRQVAELQQQLVKPEELERIKTQLIASKVYEQDSLFYQAMQIGMLETVGLNWQLADSYIEQLQALTPQQLQQVAQEYLIDSRLTVAWLLPEQES
ncbi:insulinase family protein [Ectothiorhodospiraceae bacterium BW-2]|nr:insulinase family protein [Ectothiorhodospiraceae bacterium BW-2]